MSAENIGHAYFLEKKEKIEDGNRVIENINLQFTGIYFTNRLPTVNRLNKYNMLCIRDQKCYFNLFCLALSAY